MQPVSEREQFILDYQQRFKPPGYRQGDVYLRQMGYPGEYRGPRVARVVLAEGERSGHAHVAEGDVSFTVVNGQTYLSVGSRGAVVVHEEHAPISLRAGGYEVVRQVEYDPAGATRAVRD